LGTLAFELRFPLRECRLRRSALAVELFHPGMEAFDLCVQLRLFGTMALLCCLALLGAARELALRPGRGSASGFELLHLRTQRFEFRPRQLLRLREPRLRRGALDLELFHPGLQPFVLGVYLGLFGFLCLYSVALT